MKNEEKEISERRRNELQPGFGGKCTNIAWKKMEKYLYSLTTFKSIVSTFFYQSYYHTLTLLSELLLNSFIETTALLLTFFFFCLEEKVKNYCNDFVDFICHFSLSLHCMSQNMKIN